MISTVAGQILLWDYLENRPSESILDAEPDERLSREEIRLRMIRNAFVNPDFERELAENTRLLCAIAYEKGLGIDRYKFVDVVIVYNMVYETPRRLYMELPSCHRGCTLSKAPRVAGTAYHVPRIREGISSSGGRSSRIRTAGARAALTPQDRRADPETRGMGFRIFARFFPAAFPNLRRIRHGTVLRAASAVSRRRRHRGDRTIAGIQQRNVFRYADTRNFRPGTGPFSHRRAE